MHLKDSSEAPRSAGTVSTGVGEPSSRGGCSSFTEWSDISAGKELGDHPAQPPFYRCED